IQVSELWRTVRAGFRRILSGGSPPAERRNYQPSPAKAGTLNACGPSLGFSLAGRRHWQASRFHTIVTFLSVAGAAAPLQRAAACVAASFQDGAPTRCCALRAVRRHRDSGSSRVLFASLLLQPLKDISAPPGLTARRSPAS